MISIIICSRKVDISQELKDNIASTIGCEYELCVIDNSHNDYNIFTAYNEGIRRAKGDIFCFMHEDILFQSASWGTEINEIFARNIKVGAIGVVGGQYLSAKRVAWWDASPMIGSIIQGQLDETGQYNTHYDNGGAVSEITDVVVVDGCFMCIRTSLFEKIRWDNASYNGFHIYDMDICMQILNIKYKVCVTPRIELEHQSSGVQDDFYYMALDTFILKWQKQLPIYRGIVLNSNELLWRERIMEIVSHAHFMETSLLQTKQSITYRLGKFLLKPFSWIKRKL